MSHVKEISLYLFTSFLGLLAFIFLITLLVLKGSRDKFNPEYEIQVTEQNKVILHSVSSNKYITTTPDSIVYYLELDNL